MRLQSPDFRGIYEMTDGIPNFKTYLSGRWFSGTTWSEVRSPIDLSVVARVPRISTGSARRTLGVVYEKGRWEVRDVPGEKRLEIFHVVANEMGRHIEDFVSTLMVNSGKTRLAATGEVKASIERLIRSDLDARKIFGDFIPGDWSADTLETEAVVKREPVGVVLAIIPFNYPLFDAVNKLVYSTIAGNAIIVKPASNTPLPIILLARILEIAGFPKQGLSVITMRGEDAMELASDRRVAGISLTGSSETGMKVLKAAGIKQLVLELGGGDIAIVLDDADVAWAAKRVAAGITGYAGQRCDAIKVVLSEEKIHESMKRMLIAELRKVRTGDPREPTTDMGPLIDEETAVEVAEAVNDAKNRGGRVLVGGKKPRRNYIEPTLIEVDREKMPRLKLFKNEIFAASAIMGSFRSIEEAIKTANSRDYGLDASVFGKDVDKIRRLSRMLEVGAIYVNDIPRHGIGYFPFGGRKDSGIGREGIGYTLEYVTSYKSVIYNYKGKGIWEYM